MDGVQALAVSLRLPLYLQPVLTPHSLGARLWLTHCHTGPQLRSHNSSIR